MPIRFGPRLAIGWFLSAFVSSVAAEPLAAHRLTADEIGMLAQSRPAWCLRRSNDGLACEAVAGLSTESGGRRQFWYLTLSTDINGDARKTRRRTVVQVDADGLCSTIDELAGSEILVFRAANNLANLDAEGQALNDEGLARIAAVESNSIRTSAEQRGLRPGDRYCLQVEQVGSDHQHYVITPVWAAGTERESRDTREAATFEALAKDPGLRLGGDGHRFR